MRSVKLVLVVVRRSITFRDGHGTTAAGVRVVPRVSGDAKERKGRARGRTRRHHIRVHPRECARVTVSARPSERATAKRRDDTTTTRRDDEDNDDDERQTTTTNDATDGGARPRR